MSAVDNIEEPFGRAPAPRYVGVSIRLLERGVQAEDPHAVGAMGVLLVEGQVVEADLTRGWEMIAWAAAAGNFRCALRLVLRNCQAPGTPPVEAERIYWTRILLQSLRARRRGRGSSGSSRSNVIALAPRGTDAPAGI